MSFPGESTPGNVSAPPPEEPAPARREPPREWISIRGSRIVQWIIACVSPVWLALLAGTWVPVVPVISGLIEGSREFVPADTVALLVPAAVLGVLLGLVVALPRYWTAQGIEVTGHGMVVVKRPMWWFRGRAASIPWEDVHHVSRGVRPRNKPVLDVLLYRVDHGLSMPGWAKLVLPGQTKWGRTSSSRPRVLFALDHKDVRRLEQMMRDAQPELFAVPDADPDSAPQRGRVESQWVNMRWHGVVGWIVAALVAVATAVAISVQMVREVGQPYIGASEITGGTVFLLGSLGGTVWAVCVAPRTFTRQGVSADASGITLVQDSALWFAGRTVHIPWPEVRSIVPDVVVTGSGDKRKTHAVVELMLRSPDWVSRVPSWASVFGQEVGRSPASPTEPLTRITIKPGNRRQPRIVEALRAVRPDLFPGQ
ncbi:hypothetical protein F4561_006179 [Lipingzhangella halophila]|uniref:PH domain-containing protein n=1 Tax=Lipingzhangella halophila TaxID=1783352 RepID=A0A7W7RNH8_9ACTN|nr:hypothetical protein [Lipingzhangella halophila]MBB4935285.1 hypothetical protein [Lipingzhangella halophila]